MGKASASKKIKRVQAAGVSRSAGQRRNLGFPALVVAIVLAGSLLTFFARDFRRGERADAPVFNRDHWHAAFALKVCGEVIPNEPAPDNLDGFHIHSDKLIHIHPYSKDVSGKNATFGVFARNAGIELGDGKLTLPDGRSYKNGDMCEDEDGKESPGRLALYVWPPQATDKTQPEVVTENLDKVRFDEEGMAFVLAFDPEDVEQKLPPTIDALQSPDDSDAGLPASSDEGDEPDLTIPGDDGAPSDTELPGEPGDGGTVPTESTVEPGD